MRRLRMLTFVVCFLVLAVIVAGCGGSATTPVPPSIPMATYENTEHGFSVKYPEGWAKSEREIGANFSFEFKDPEGRLTAEVSVEYRTEEIVLTDLVSETKGYMKAMPQYELISEGDVTIGEGISGYEIVGKGDLGTGKVEKFRYVVLIREKQGFWVGARGEPAYFDQQEQLIDTIVDSFKLLSTYTYVPPTPSAGGTYTNAQYGFSITYPEGWIEAPTGRPVEVVSLSAAEGLPSIIVRAWTEETTLAEYASNLKKDIGKHVGDYELVSEGEITLDDGTPAYEIVFSGTMEGYLLKCKYVIVIQEANVFLMQGFNMPAQFEQDEAVLDGVIRSFHLE